MNRSIRLVWAMVLLLAGCGRGSETLTGDLGPLGEEQGKLATDAVTRVREAFNAGACQSIYEGAAEFFRSREQGRWQSECERLRERLGQWQSFEVRETVRCGGTPTAVIVCVDGQGVFTTGTHRMEMAFQCERGQARLFWLGFEDSNQWRQIPPLPPSPNRRFDPPPRERVTARYGNSSAKLSSWPSGSAKWK